MIHGKINEAEKNINDITSGSECFDACKDEDTCKFYTWSYSRSRCLLFATSNLQEIVDAFGVFSGQDWCKRKKAF